MSSKVTLSMLLLSMMLVLYTSCLKVSLLNNESISNHVSAVQVYGFLTPGDSIYVYVKVPSLQGGAQEHPSAEVILSNGSAQIRLSNDKNGLLYKATQKDFPIRVGETYALTVDIKGVPLISAQTTVPPEKAVWRFLETYRIDSYSTIVSGVWSKVPNAYYGVLLNWKDLYPQSDKLTSEGITNLDSATLGVKKDIHISSDVAVVKATLLTRDYNYQKYSEVYDISSMVASSLAEPDFTDIFSTFKGQIPSFSNIKNGTGVFGSFLKDERDIDN